jgi:hypothetical protein
MPRRSGEALFGFSVRALDGGFVRDVNGEPGGRSASPSIPTCLAAFWSAASSQGSMVAHRYGKPCAGAFSVIVAMLPAVRADRHFDLTQFADDLTLEPPQAVGAPGRRRVRLNNPDYRHFNATLCPLRKPVVLLKAGRSGSTSIEEVLMTVLQYCPGYQEISHNSSLLEHGCTDAVLTEQRRIWSEALANNGIISHNPTTDAGGCFSSYHGGARHLTSLLRGSGATVVSWTRNNVLRQKYSDMAARVSGDYGGHTTADAPLWEGSPKGIAGAAIKSACQMLAIQSAHRMSTERHEQVIQYEDYANDPYSTVERLLGWASLKDGYTPEGLLAPHAALLERRPEPEMPSCAKLFKDPDGVPACGIRRPA